MSLAIRAKFDPLRTLDHSLISGTYYGVGTELLHPARALYLYNNTDRSLVFSFNGIDDHLNLPSLGYWFFDIASNKTVAQGWFLAEGERLYVKTPTTNPTLGEVNFTVIYGVEI